MKAVAALVVDGFGHEGGEQAVPGRHRLDDGFKNDGVLRRREGVREAEIDFVLPRALLVMAALRAQAHLFHEQADLAPHVFALGPWAPRRNSPLGRRASWWDRRLRPARTGRTRTPAPPGMRSPCRQGAAHAAPKDLPPVPFKAPPVGVADIAEEAYHAPLLGAPGQDGQRGRDPGTGTDRSPPRS